MRRFELSSGEGQYPIHAAAMLIGEDLLVAIWGGTQPHIGAVSLAQPRPSLADPERTSATASVLARPGHKDDDVAKMVSEYLAASLAKNVVVTVGIHWDHLNQEAIEEIVANCRELAEALSKGAKEQWSKEQGSNDPLRHCDLATYDIATLESNG